VAKVVIERLAAYADFAGKSRLFSPLLAGRAIVTAAAWLCTLLDDDEVRRELPQLPAVIEFHSKLAKKL
jgi:hypothetical protein